MLLALAVVLLAVACVPLLLWPELAPLVVLFLLYSNVPVVLSKLRGVPEVVAGSFIMLLGIPLVYFVVLRRERARVDSVFGWMVVLLGTMLVSSLGARDPAVALDKIETYLFEGVLPYWLVINTVRTPATLKRAIWAVLAAGTMLGSMSIYQSATGDYQTQFGGLAWRRVAPAEGDVPGAAPPEAKFTRVMRNEGPQLGANRYAQVMLVLVPLALLQWRNGRSRGERALAATAGGVILIGGVALSYSRGAYLSLALMIVAAAFVVGWIRPARLVVYGFCALLLLPAAAPTAVKRLETLTAVTDLDDADGSLRGRATEMLAALRVLRDYPVLGVGPGQYTPFYSIEYQQQGIAYRELDIDRRAHMLYFEIGAEGGVIGLVTFLVIPLLLLYRLRRAQRYWANRRPQYADFAAAFVLSILGFLATALFLSYAFERYYWCLMALAGSSVLLLRLEATRQEREERMLEPAHEAAEMGSVPGARSDQPPWVG